MTQIDVNQSTEVIDRFSKYNISESIFFITQDNKTEHCWEQPMRCPVLDTVYKCFFEIEIQ